jgi:hypothetical protein
VNKEAWGRSWLCCGWQHDFRDKELLLRSKKFCSLLLKCMCIIQNSCSLGHVLADKFFKWKTPFIEAWIQQLAAPTSSIKFPKFLPLVAVNAPVCTFYLIALCAMSCSEAVACVLLGLQRCRKCSADHSPDSHSLPWLF